MTYSVTWPSTLPPMPLSNYSETLGIQTIRTSPDLGPSKLRRRASRPDQVQVTYNMSSLQVETLRTFVQDTLRGTIRFGWTHPRKGSVVEARFVPSGDQYFTVSYIAPDYWAVSFTLEIMP